MANNKQTEEKIKHIKNIVTKLNDAYLKESDQTFKQAIVDAKECLTEYYDFLFNEQIEVTYEPLKLESFNKIYNQLLSKLQSPQIQIQEEISQLLYTLKTEVENKLAATLQALEQEQKNTEIYKLKFKQELTNNSHLSKTMEMIKKEREKLEKERDRLSQNLTQLNTKLDFRSQTYIKEVTLFNKTLETQKQKHTKEVEQLNQLIKKIEDLYNKEKSRIIEHQQQEVHKIISEHIKEKEKINLENKKEKEKINLENKKEKEEREFKIKKEKEEREFKIKKEKEERDQKDLNMAKIIGCSATGLAAAGTIYAASPIISSAAITAASTIGTSALAGFGGGIIACALSPLAVPIGFTAIGVSGLSLFVGGLASSTNDKNFNKLYSKKK
ncbi:hypothetical protein AB837_00527 [bacterium AB1]|nr:hypothetical protein AB837_00527 [bacterium AB1]